VKVPKNIGFQYPSPSEEIWNCQISVPFGTLEPDMYRVIGERNAGSPIITTRETSPCED
jgi:hypothetical protein